MLMAETPMRKLREGWYLASWGFLACEEGGREGGREGEKVR